MMNLKGIVAAVICVSLILGASSAQAAGLNKVAYVDVAKIFNEYEATKDSEAKLNAKQKVKQEERDALVHEIRTLKDELVLLSDEGKREKQVVIDEKIKGLQDFDRQVGQTLGQERNEAVRQIFEEIDAEIKEYGKTNRYDMIFNERFLLYYGTEYDITDDILKSLNKKYKK